MAGEGKEKVPERSSRRGWEMAADDGFGVPFRRGFAIDPLKSLSSLRLLLRVLSSSVLFHVCTVSLSFSAFLPCRSYFSDDRFGHFQLSQCFWKNNSDWFSFSIANTARNNTFRDSSMFYEKKKSEKLVFDKLITMETAVSNKSFIATTWLNNQLRFN